MKKKLLTVALAAVMTVASTVGAMAETLTSTATAWWADVKAGTDYTLAADSEVVLYATCLEHEVEAGYGFMVETYVPSAETGSKMYITATNNDDAWSAEGLTYTNAPASGNPQTTTKGTATLEAGTVVKVTVKRTGDDVSFEFYNMTANEVYRNFVFEGTNYSTATGDVMVHFSAQTGSFEVSTTAPEVATTTAASAANEGETTTVAGDATTAATTTAATTTTTPNTGDSTMVVALLAVAALSAVVVLKKKTVTE